MTKKTERKGLGRGLSSLLATSELSTQTATQTLPIEKLRANPDQPRKLFHEHDLNDLTASIRVKGIIQPLIVRPDPTDPDLHQIVAGERRWRAAQKAQIHDIPVIIQDLTDSDVLEIGIIENIQRADLNPIEEAMAFRQLMDKFSYTQEQLAESLSKSRSHIANSLRLLNLPADVLDHVSHGRLSAGHARALVTAENPSGLAQQIITQGLSVRQTEHLAKKGKAQAKPSKPKSHVKDADTRAIENDLAAHLKMKVQINHNASGEGGELRISYRSLDDLDALLQTLSGN